MESQDQDQTSPSAFNNIDQHITQQILPNFIPIHSRLSSARNLIFFITQQFTAGADLFLKYRILAS